MGVVNGRICLRDSSFWINFSCNLCISFSLTDYFHPSFLIFKVFELRQKNSILGNTAQRTSSQSVCFIPMPYALGWIFQDTPTLSISVPSKKEITCQWIQNCSLPSAFENPGKPCLILCYHSFQQGAVTI